MKTGIDHIGNRYGLLGDEEHPVATDLGEDDDVAEEQRPIGLDRAALDARQIATEYPLSALDGQCEGFALGEDHAGLEVLQREQRSPLAQRLHEAAADGDLSIGGLQFGNDGAEVLMLLGVHMAIASEQLHQLQYLTEMLQWTVYEHREVGTLARHSWLRDERYELGARLAGLVHQHAVGALDAIAVLLVGGTDRSRLGQINPRGEVHVRLLLLIVAAQLLQYVLGDAQQLIDVLEQCAMIVRRDQVLALQQWLHESLQPEVQGGGKVLFATDELQQKATPVVRDGHYGLQSHGERVGKGKREKERDSERDTEVWLRLLAGFTSIPDRVF